MQVPVQLDFQGIEASEMLRTSIQSHVEELEDRFGRITACRVVVKGPGGRHQTGGLYEVNIWLSLPAGREVAVVRTPHLDERHADPAFAINDAFKRARRRLQDRVRRLRNEVKTHEGQPVARVAQLPEGAEFGFLVTEDGREIYFHRNSVLDGQFGQLKVGTRVTYAEEMGNKGPQASTVRKLARQGARS